MPSLDWLPERTRGPIEAAVPAIASALGDGLVAVCLIGPAAKPERNPRAVHVHAELLVVAERLDVVNLHELAAELVEPLRSGLQIRTLTRAELAGSVDVHALELAQWRDHSLLLGGRDPFAELDIAADDLRHEIERSLRSLIQRLRSRMLWCIATDQRHLDAVLRESVELLAMLAHHTLTLAGEQPPAGDEALLGRLASFCGHDARCVLAVRERLELAQPADDPLAELEDLLALTETLCGRVDGLAV